MSRVKLLALRDRLAIEIRAVNLALGIKKSSKGAGHYANKAACFPELWAKRLALAEQIKDVNLQLSTATEPILVRSRRPALAITPEGEIRMARPEGPRVPQRLYTQTVRKFLKPNCYPRF